MLRTESVYTLLTKNDKSVEKEQDAETLRIRDLSSAWIKDQVLLEGLGNCSVFLAKSAWKGKDKKGVGETGLEFRSTCQTSDKPVLVKWKGCLVGQLPLPFLFSVKKMNIDSALGSTLSSLK